MSWRTEFNFIYRFIVLGVLVFHLIPRGRAILEFSITSQNYFSALLTAGFFLFSLFILLRPRSGTGLRLAYSLTAFFFYGVLSRNSGLQSYDFFAPVFALFFLSIFPFERRDLGELAILCFTRLLFLTYSVAGAFKVAGLYRFFRDGYSFATNSFLSSQLLISQVAAPVRLPVADLFLTSVPVFLQNTAFLILALMEFLAFFAAWNRRLTQVFLLFFVFFHTLVFFMMDINFFLNVYLLLGLFIYFNKKPASFGDAGS